MLFVFIIILYKMQNLELIKNTREYPQIQCETEKSLFTNLFGIVKSLGLFKPRYVVSKTSKGVRISKKKQDGKVIYILTILDFEPPIQIYWTKPTPLSQIIQVIREIVDTKKSIAYINHFTVSSQNNVSPTSLYQIAIA